jgi:hypothetical protein
VIVTLLSVVLPDIIVTGAGVMVWVVNAVEVTVMVAVDIAVVVVTL